MANTARMKKNGLPHYVTTLQAATIKGVSKTCIQGWKRDGLLTPVAVLTDGNYTSYLYDEAQVQAFTPPRKQREARKPQEKAAPASAQPSPLVLKRLLQLEERLGDAINQRIEEAVDRLIAAAQPPSASAQPLDPSQT